GGQLTTTTEVENYPGFPETIGGPDLMVKMREQSVKYGATIRTETVERVDLSSQPYSVFTAGAEYKAMTVIIATGATAIRLDFPGESTYWQKGISACAVCDGGLPIFRNRPLVVIGGGDSACEEASYLSKFGSEVIMLVRRNVLRASKAMQNRVFNNPKIAVRWNNNAIEAIGEQTLTAVKVRNNKTQEKDIIEAGGLFFAIGHKPNTEFLAGQLEMDETGYVITAPDSTRTAKPGVYACGDVKDRIYRQAITAAGSGCMAALEAERYLADLESGN
ncbi:MAG: FAD-dependent oxidoreductase, partial [Spirochaetaceae bacterium]|nr:FAD-dependent oxidoreductase [Spirochaetaceae bacterium]